MRACELCPANRLWSKVTAGELVLVGKPGPSPSLPADYLDYAAARTNRPQTPRREMRELKPSAN